MTLPCEDDSKLVEVGTVAHVDDEKGVDNSLMQICTRFDQDFEVDVHARF